MLYSAAVLPPVLSSPRSYRLSHLLAPLKGRPAIAASATCCKTRRDHPEPPSIRRNFNRNQPEYGPHSLILLRLSHRSAESPSPALCTFVAFDSPTSPYRHPTARFHTIAETLLHTALAFSFCTQTLRRPQDSPSSLRRVSSPKPEWREYTPSLLWPRPLLRQTIANA